MLKGNPCTDKSKACFVRKYDLFVDQVVCTCLTHPEYAEGTCPFAKPRREWTKGRFYPYNEALINPLVRKELKELSRKEIINA